MTRLPDATLRTYHLHAYRQLRTWLQDAAPDLYLLTSADQAVAAGGTVATSAISATFECPYRVDRELSDGSYRPMEAADAADPNTHQLGNYTWRLENDVFRFGPDANFSGDIRVLYYATPAALSADGDNFAVPVNLELPLVYFTCALVAIHDQDGAGAAKAWRDLADLPEVARQLRKRRGVHQQRAGLHKVRRY